MVKKIFSIAALLLAIIVIGCGDTKAEKLAGGKAIDFELQDIYGSTVKLSDYSGRVIVLNFFATWCPPCREEMPGFNQIATEYKDKVKIIAINVGRESISKVRKFASLYGLEITIVMDDGKVSASYGPIRAIPVTVIIDRDFNIAKRYIGMRTKEVFIKDIEELL